MYYHGFVFNADVAAKAIVEWIRDWFRDNGDGCNCVVGLSGGKDSTVVAALCVQALGKDRVIGVSMPNIHQDDIQDAYDAAEFLGIQCYTIPITLPVADIQNQITHAGIELTKQLCTNLPARIRMTTLYAMAQALNGRVANTCNLSEDYIGWATRWGDSVGDFCPISQYTVTEVIEIGRVLGLPEHLITKAPADGLTGKTDEANFGFTYATLDTYLIDGEIEDERCKQKIDEMHAKNVFKLKMPPNAPFTYENGCKEYVRHLGL